MKYILSLLLIVSFANSDAQTNADLYSKLYNDGITAIDQKDYSQAKKLLSEAIKLNPKYAEAIFARGTCSLMLNEWDAACNDFEKSYQLDWKPSREYIDKYCGADSYGKKVNQKKAERKKQK